MVTSEYGINQRNAETHIEVLNFEEILKNMETQTSIYIGNDVITQTNNNFIDTASMTDFDCLQYFGKLFDK